MTRIVIASCVCGITGFSIGFIGGVSTLLIKRKSNFTFLNSTKVKHLINSKIYMMVYKNDEEKQFLVDEHNKYNILYGNVNDKPFELIGKFNREDFELKLKPNFNIKLLPSKDFLLYSSQIENKVLYNGIYNGKIIYFDDIKNVDKLTWKEILKNGFYGSTIGCIFGFICGFEVFTGLI